MRPAATFIAEIKAKRKGCEKSFDIFAKKTHEKLKRTQAQTLNTLEAFGGGHQKAWIPPAEHYHRHHTQFESYNGVLAIWGKGLDVFKIF